MNITGRVNFCDIIKERAQIGYEIGIGLLVFCIRNQRVEHINLCKLAHVLARHSPSAPSAFEC